MAGLPATQVAGPCFACGEMGHIQMHYPKLATLGAEDNKMWYSFEGGCNGSVLEEGGK